jgi:hypothetical protein
LERDREHFPSDRELDEIKQLLDTRTIHIQLGANPDVDSAATDAVVGQVQNRMLKIFGQHALGNAARNESSPAYQSMYDTALMRIWWEKFGDTVNVRRSTGDGEAGGRLGAVDGADADNTTELHKEAHQVLDQS